MGLYFILSELFLLRVQMGKYKQNKNHWNLRSILSRWAILELSLCSWCDICNLASIWSLYLLTSSGNLWVQSSPNNGAKSESVTVSNVTKSCTGLLIKVFTTLINKEQKKNTIIFIFRVYDFRNYYIQNK